MTNKDLLRQIQDEAVDGKADLSTGLRKCLVLASRLGHEPLKNWAQRELNGYPKTSEVPEYRVLHGLESFGHFLGIGGSGLKDAPLDSFRLPESIRKGFTDPEIHEGVQAKGTGMICGLCKLGFWFLSLCSSAFSTRSETGF